MRHTKQRDLILSIVNNNYTHPTALDIYNLCRKEIPNISLGTIYRNLNSLVEDNLIKRIKMPNNIDRFDQSYSHAHFICIKCNNVIDLGREFIIDKDVIDNNKVVDCEVNFRGICSECQKKGC